MECLPGEEGGQAQVNWDGKPGHDSQVHDAGPPGFYGRPSSALENQIVELRARVERLEKLLAEKRGCQCTSD